ncbi:DUF4199 domain-containing protein [Hymenobacter sp. BT507]|uniref:DUF4199 domain-containing protein n=1 Tax=Hymenobacter citatus TaxID=2763506 RepID=A0ABR7MQ50_9BACT|nr:DUF4199 domain-containing protein [Hymenobacter citatus]
MQSSSSLSHPVLRTALRFGVGAGLLSVAWVAALYLVGVNPFGGKRLLTMLFVVGAVLVSQWWVRRYFQPEGPGLGRSFGAGIITTVVAAALSATGLYGIAQVAGPEAMQRHLTEMRQLLESNKEAYLQQRNGQEQYERTLQNLASTPQGLAADDLKNKLLFGLLISLPGAVFFRR